jgi:uncharacterized membrane protein SpoIIM required for sporulation
VKRVLEGSAKKGRIETWERLEHLLSISAGRGVKALSEEQLWELPGLYRRAMSDLSLLRSQGAHPSEIQQLSNLCNRAHAVIYAGTARKRGPGFWQYVGRELPIAVRRNTRYIFAAVAVTVLFSIIGWVHALISPGHIDAILGPETIREYESSLRHAEAQSDLRLAAQIPEEERSFSAFYITVNNIKVSVNAFASGILGGVPTLMILAFNGYFLGTIAFLYFNTTPGIDVNLPMYFLAGVAPHGAIELPAIFVAGAAGMLLGFSWVFPGGRSRGEALRDAARDAFKLLMTCALTLLVAGAIEGFVTPLYPPTGLTLNSWFVAKIIFGSAVFLCWLAWLMLGGRKQEAAANEA